LRRPILSLSVLLFAITANAQTFIGVNKSDLAGTTAPKGSSMVGIVGNTGKTLTDLFDGGYDLHIQPSALTTTGAVTAGSVVTTGTTTINDLIAGGPWVDVRKHGVTLGTGQSAAVRTANTAGLAAAVATGDTVLLPGDFEIDDEVELNTSGQVIMGFGRLSTIYQATSDKGVFKRAATGRIYNLLLKDFRLMHTATVSGGTAIDWTGVSDSEIRNVNVAADSATDGFAKGLVLDGTSARGALRNEVYNLRVRTYPGASSVAVELIGGTGGANSNHFWGGYLQADDGKGVLFTAGSEMNQNSLNGIVFEGDTATAVDLNGDSSTSQGNVISGCRFENNSGAGNTGVLMAATSMGNLLVGNTYVSSLTAKWSDLGGRNMKIEPTALAGTAIELGTKGNFVGHATEDALARDNWGVFSAEMASTSPVAFAAGITGEAHPTWKMKGSRMQWGPGGASDVDVGFTRSTTATLQLELGKLQIAGSGLQIGTAGTTLTKLNEGAAASVADGGTITHGMGDTPTVVTVTPSVAGEMAAVTAIGATTFTVSIKKHDNSAGTTQTIYWRASK